MTEWQFEQVCQLQPGAVSEDVCEGNEKERVTQGRRRRERDRKRGKRNRSVRDAWR